MSARARNPYLAESLTRPWAKGYRADRDGLTKQHNPYLKAGMRRAWWEGFDASARDRKAGID